jgi:hypothetical protein
MKKQQFNGAWVDKARRGMEDIKRCEPFDCRPRL